MGSASETARGSHLHPEPVAGLRLHGRPEEDLPAVLRQVVQPRGRDVLPAARGHPPRPPDQRAHHSVSDMKGKFIKPTLKKVSKYENKFAKLQEKAAKFAFANQLKQSKG